MFPTICKIGPVSIYSYGLMLATAVLICTYFLAKDASKFFLSKDFIYDLMFWLVFGGILGARVFYVLMNLDYFIQYPFDIIKINEGGIAWQGGLITSIGILFFLTRKRKLSFLKIFDMLAPYIALGQSIGRIGCFLNGCCYGRHADWGIYFPVHGDHLHPTQLYDSAGLFIIFFILRQIQKNSKKDGGTMVAYILLACSLRFGVEFFRADHFTLIWGLSIFQYVCLGLILFSLIINSRLKPRS